MSIDHGVHLGVRDRALMISREGGWMQVRQPWDAEGVIPQLHPLVEAFRQSLQPFKEPEKSFGAALGTARATVLKAAEENGRSSRLEFARDSVREVVLGDIQTAARTAQSHNNIAIEKM